MEMEIKAMLFILLAFISICGAQCPEANSCDVCITTPGCGFCPAIEKCLTGGPSGPNSSICNGWLYNACPICSVYSSCTSCTDQSDCGWIDSTSSCVTVNTPGMSKFCSCGEYDQCTDCKRASCVFCENSGICQSHTAPDCISTSDSLCNCTHLTISGCDICSMQDDICGWCTSDKSCKFYEEPCESELTNTCTVSTRKFDGVSFIGGIILTGSVVLIIGIIIYIIYKFYKPRQINSAVISGAANPYS